MPSFEARLGETQPTYGMSVHEAIEGPQHPPQPLPIENPSIPREEVCASSVECHTCCRIRARPSDFWKWVTKFIGSSYVYHHLASFRQVSRAKRVTDLHTLVEGFGMTLEGKALEWFHTLTPSSFPSLKVLEKDFIAAFSKIGQKHDGLSLLYEFKQESSESMRDNALQFKKHLARCPKSKLPCQERLVSLFIKGLLNCELHAMLYIKHHKTMNECIHDAIEFDDIYKRTMSHD